MKDVSHEARAENRILSLLPDKDRRQMLSRLEPVPLPSSKVIYEIGAPIDYVYFLDSGLASLISYTQEGGSLEMAIIGYEGMAGLQAFLGSDLSAYRVIQQFDGHALRMKAGEFKSECDRLRPLRALMLRYTQTVVIQISQTALCNRYHEIEARLCCWLLLCQDIIRSDHLQLTQEFLAYMLGCRRAGVTVAAGKMQSRGLIGYTRGNVLILDREGLKAASCECYEVITTALEWLRGG
ncbi:MAG TPA: Crp/Fnr family transcriptional regulator [Blastocatellia bacterium]|nr:Crp/Fnr family transcriptional regulator [Blastocatellia bacterium]